MRFPDHVVEAGAKALQEELRFVNPPYAVARQVLSAALGALVRDPETLLKDAMNAGCDEAERLGYGGQLGYAEAASISEAAVRRVLGALFPEEESR